MARSLYFYQVYYEDSQLDNLYPFAIPHKNDAVTNYFENSIISDLVPQSDADLISVCSWRLSNKRIDRSMQLKGKTELTYEMITESDFDIAVLTPVSKSHQALVMAEAWHGSPWTCALKELKKFINVPRELNHPIYENHFIATKEIYHEYVLSFLNPVIAYMSYRPVFFADSNYAKRKSESDRKRYSERTGKSDWPIAPFILERLFSIWINDKQFKIINL
jgi:hypothetical protein